MRSLIIALIALAALFFWLFRETQQGAPSREEKQKAFINELNEIDKDKVEEMLFEGDEEGPSVEGHDQPDMPEPGEDASEKRRKPDQASDQEFQQKLQELKQRVPDIYAIRDHAQQNPHTTPPQFFEFSEALASLMEDALKNEQKASALFGELEFCAADNSEIPTTVQSVCLTNMSRLAGAYESSLSERFSDVKSQASPAAQDFLKLIE